MHKTSSHGNSMTFSREFQFWVSCKEVVHKRSISRNIAIESLSEYNHELFISIWSSDNEEVHFRRATKHMSKFLNVSETNAAAYIGRVEVSCEPDLILN